MTDTEPETQQGGEGYDNDLERRVNQGPSVGGEKTEDTGRRCYCKHRVDLASFFYAWPGRPELSGYDRIQNKDTVDKSGITEGNCG